MPEDDIVYLDGHRLSLKELGVTRDGLNNPPKGRVILFMMSDEMRSLYRRAIEDRASITPEEKSRVMGNMPLEEEERLSQERLGCSKADLLNKARSRGDDLSKLECDMILKGFDYHWKRGHPWSQFERMASLTTEERHMVHNARSELTTGLEAVAMQNARNKDEEYQAARSAENKQKRQRNKAAREAPHAFWVQGMADKKLPRWGFVVFRTEYDGSSCDELWAKFQQCYNETCRVVMGRWSGRSPRIELWTSHESLFVSDPSLQGATTDDVRKMFKDMRQDLPEGIRRDCFLIGDKPVLMHQNTADGADGAIPRDKRQQIPIKAANPDYDPSKPLATEEYPYESRQTSITEQDLQGFAGEIRVPLCKVFDWLHYSLLVDATTWERRYWLTTKHEHQVLLPYSPYPGYCLG